MDSWSNDQVDNMKSKGNTASNHIYNPKNTQPPIPLDVDEVDSAMERFIRQKYDQQAFSGGRPRVPAARAPVYHHTGSSDDQPPPPPPKSGKPGRRFGFGLRSVSSALPLSRSSQDSSPATPDFPRKASRPPSPIRINKQSRVFGASIGVTEEGMEWKLGTLRSMGFPDDRRNSNILKGLGGDLERAIESLIRLGEGTTPASRSRTPVSAKFPEVSRPATKVSDVQSQAGIASPPAGAQVQRQIAQHNSQGQALGVASPSIQSSQSYNPFENLSRGPVSAPFQQQPLENAFQNIQISQPLFPNATGGYPNQQQQLEHARMQQSMTPPVPQMPRQFSLNNPYSQQPQSAYNPFVNSTQQISPVASANPFLATQQNFGAHDQFGNQSSLNEVLSQPNQSQYQQHSQAQYHQPIQTQFQQPQQQWLQQTQQTNQDSPQHMFSAQNFGQPLQPPPFMQQPIQSPSYSPTMQSPFFIPQTQQQQQPPQNYPSLGQQPIPQALIPQQTGRYDKSSIMALYNYPQLAPPPLSQVASGSPSADFSSSPQPPAARLPPGVAGLGQQQRSATMPAMLSSGSKNPFLHSGTSMASQGPPAQIGGGSRQVSQETVDSGRHSPDAFASLSARFVR
ncbi:hypothetical protein MMC19_000750 [Ptychographa xylographoides]|nr:hypothetical protein [Ptychographa xylographoides]